MASIIHIIELEIVCLFIIQIFYYNSALNGSVFSFFYIAKLTLYKFAKQSRNTNSFLGAA